VAVAGTPPNGAREAPTGRHVGERQASSAADRDNDENETSDRDDGTARNDTTSDEPTWPQLLVKVLGRPHVPDRRNLRRRELALVVYLASKGQPTPATSVQHAVWNGRAVHTKTIWNVATATRATLGQLDDGSPAMPASQRAHNTLAVAPGVRTDLQLLQDLYNRAQHAPSTRAMELLQRGLDLIEGQPFDGPDFEWAHHTELLVAHATRLTESATEHLVELATSAGRIDLARHAITQGLRALPGNEVLYRARMTVEHDDGNLAAVRSAYEELVSFLTDIDAEPSQATISLYRQLRPQPGRHAS
jgi:DNA-binding SARP family transcriptional activator